ncbi:NADPH-dependent FMN reductase [Streptomyces sp. NPDC001595]|uniref:NADPH-dependent FMN reductase n=1 Tax=Streptomyces sp. NPDC001532 TaxID=3154520 RepID=UPI003325D576
MSKPVLQIIVAGTRPSEAGASVGAWIAETARTHGGFEVEVVDLAEVDLPLCHEPHGPSAGEYVHEHTRRWSARVRRANAFVLVTPEYNDGYPAALKNALDHLNREWWYKAVSFVSFGGVSGGLRAVQQLRQVVGVLRMVPVADAVSVPFVDRHIDAEGAFRSSGTIEASAKKMLDELRMVGTPLIPLQSAVLEG